MVDTEITLDLDPSCEKYKDMDCTEFKKYMAENYPNTCGRSEEDERNRWSWHMFGPECNKGWWGLFEEYCKTSEEYYNKFGVGTYVLQFKEKFGGPRLYVGSLYSPEKNEMVNSKNDETENHLIHIISSHLQKLASEYEEKMANVSGMTGKKINYGSVLFSRHGWIWDSDVEEVIQLYSRLVEEEKDEEKKKSFIEILASAKEQKERHDTGKIMRNDLSCILRIGDKEEIENVKNILNHQKNAIQERRKNT